MDLVMYSVVGVPTTFDNYADRQSWSSNSFTVMQFVLL